MASCCRAQALGHAGSAVLGHVESSQPRGLTGVPCIARHILNHWTIREAQGKFLLKGEEFILSLKSEYFLHTHTNFISGYTKDYKEQNEKHLDIWDSPKQALETRHNPGLSHTQDGGHLPWGPSRTCDGVDNGSKDSGRLYQFFEDVWLSSQWKAIVEHLFQHLINHDHVVFYHWFWTDSKIILMQT